MATMNVSLPDGMKQWVDKRADGVRYANVSDYVRDLIRRDQEREQAIAELQTLVDEGIASGEAQPFDIDQFLKEVNETNDSGNG